MPKKAKNQGSEPRVAVPITVYTLIKGASLDDAPRTSLRADVASCLKKFGVASMKDGDAGVIPGLSIEQDERYSPQMIVPTDGIVNVFAVGCVKDFSKFDPKGLRKAMSELIKVTKNVTRANLAFSIVVVVSPFHRHIHRDHTCVPSVVMAQFDNTVIVESCLVDQETGKLLHSPTDLRGQVVFFEEPSRTHPVTIPTRDWQSQPEITAIPDGSVAGVGGRTLIYTFALERGHYHGGDLPESIKGVTPEMLGMVEERAPDSLPMLMLANKVSVLEALGGSGYASGLGVEMVLKNESSSDVDVSIPAGSLFEVIDPKRAVQNLASAQGMRIRMSAGETKRVTVPAYCANHHFSSPNNEAIRPTIFKLENGANSQGAVWNDLDGRGY